jgi:hypothetical protein
LYYRHTGWAHRACGQNFFVAQKRSFTGFNNLSDSMEKKD